ncbi:hypothetical protein BDF14DRAFT_1723110 [Spinellus fusiger]|nr:hypothetical protein BDF14DRAFT_1723110 [Spinellus fusiger]
MSKPPRKRLRLNPTTTRTSFDFARGLFSDELVLHIFSYLSAVDLTQCAMVSTCWSRLAGDEWLWKPLFLHRFRHRPAPIQTPFSSSHQPWKIQYRISHNWRSGNCSVKCIENSSISAMAPNSIQCIAGYDRGGIMLWQITHDFKATELAYTPSVSGHTSQAKVISIGLAYPMLALCTANMEVTILYDVSGRFRQIYQAQSQIQWSLIQIYVHKIIAQASPLWQVMLCFGMSANINACPVSLQEINVSPYAYVSSRHCSAYDSTDLLFTSQPPVTALAYDYPHLITAHANNTIRQYKVEMTQGKFKINFIQVLYGHTCEVTALSLNGPAQRLVSGDRSGLKVWDLEGKTEHGIDRRGQLFKWQQGGDHLVTLHSTDKDNTNTNTWHVHWLYSDATKIVALKSNPAWKERERKRIEVYSFRHF